MKKIWIALFIIYAAMLFSSCKKSDGAKNAALVQQVNIKIENVKPSQLVDGIQIAGTVKAIEDASISPEEGGVVKQWVVEKGRAVKKGDIIILLNDDVIKAGYDAAVAQYKMADLNAQKQKKVFEEQGISELQYKNLLYARDAAKANADLMKARFERTKIKSPFNGTVENIIPNVGEFAPPGMPIARVVNTSMVKIQAEVPEKFAASLSPGVLADITFDALAEETIRGTVSFVGSTVSASNRTLIVEIVIKNPGGKLKPEMVAKVNLLREVKKNAILIDESLVQLVDRNRRIVYVENSGKAEERQIEIGGRQGSQLEVVHGLQIGDRLIVSGFQKLVNGSPVVITE